MNLKSYCLLHLQISSKTLNSKFCKKIVVCQKNLKSLTPVWHYNDWCVNSCKHNKRDHGWLAAKICWYLLWRFFGSSIHVSSLLMDGFPEEANRATRIEINNSRVSSSGQFFYSFKIHTRLPVKLEICGLMFDSLKVLKNLCKSMKLLRL